MVCADSFARIYGVYRAMQGELAYIFEFKKFLRKIFCIRTPAVILTLEKIYTNIGIISNQFDVKPGNSIYLTRVPVGLNISNETIGSVIDCLGEIKKESNTSRSYKFVKSNVPLDTKAIGIIGRSPINEPLSTGFAVIDTITPIGMGQRQLFIGDKGTGKTETAVSSILNQRERGDVFCIYVAIGQRTNDVVKFSKKFLSSDFELISNIASSVADTCTKQYLSPYTGCTIGETFAKAGAKNLIVYDDLTIHANAYRQMSLLLRKPGGREAFPGDVFYLHARLLERAGKFSARYDNGSLTALPLIETQLGDVSSFIPTNVISITDGQCFFDAKLFKDSTRPAVNLEYSVSRVGANAQLEILRELSKGLKKRLAEFRHHAKYIHFMHELAASTQNTIYTGLQTIKFLNQDLYEDSTNQKFQSFLIYFILNRDILKIKNVKSFKKDLLSKFRQSNIY
jgi:proton translocating ATP synthase F1 alpha subunit